MSRDERYYSRSGRDDFPSTPVASIDTGETEAQIQHALEGGGISNALQVKTKDGKASWLFFKNLSPEVAGLLEYAYSTIKPFIGKHGAAFLYDKTGDAMHWLRPQATEAAKHKAGLHASKAFFAALILADPIQRLLGVRSEYNEEKKKLFSAIAPVIEANKGEYKDNEIINAAVARLRGDVSAGLKGVAAELPIIGLTTWFAARDYSAIRKSKAAESAAKRQAGKPDHELHDEFDRAWLEREQKIQASKKQFEDQYRAEGLDEKEIRDRLRKYEAHARDRYNQKDTLHDEMRAREREHHHIPGFDGTTATMALAAAATNIFKSKIGGRGDNPIALDLILQLAADVQNESGVHDLKERILEIFQQNERDHHRQPIGSRLLPQLEPTIDCITKAISRHTLNPLALINLVGGRNKIISYQNGKRVFATCEQAEALIGEQRRVLSAPEKMTEEEFYSDLLNPEFIKNILKETLDMLPEDQKAGVAALFPADVLTSLGYAKDRVAEWQIKGHDYLYPLISLRALELSEKTDEELKKLNLNSQDIESIRVLAESVLSGDRQAVEAEVDGQDKTGLAAIRRATLCEQAESKEGSGFWQSLIQRTRRLPEMIAERRKQAEAVARDDRSDAEPRAGRMAGMRENSGTPFANEHKIKREEASSLSASGRELRRRDAEPSEGVTIGN